MAFYGSSDTTRFFAQELSRATREVAARYRLRQICLQGAEGRRPEEGQERGDVDGAEAARRGREVAARHLLPKHPLHLHPVLECVRLEYLKPKMKASALDKSFY